MICMLIVNFHSVAMYCNSLCVVFSDIYACCMEITFISIKKKQKKNLTSSFLSYHLISYDRLLGLQWWFNLEICFTFIKY